jgi:fucose 4-O-acetylase-like acetyltransferase
MACGRFILMKTRDTYYDNVKFLLIFLVVFGHFIQSYIHGDHFIYTLYTTIYTFHMPAFILISGFFAKGFHQKGYLKTLTKKLLIPYLIFQGIYSFYYYFINSKPMIELDPFNPQWSLWFLVSLFCWNVLLFLFTRWKPTVALSFAIAIGVAVGYVTEINQYLSLSRTFVFFPFFLLGYFLQKEHFERFRSVKFKYLSLLILTSVFLAFYFWGEMDYRWLFGSKPYEVLASGSTNGGIVRLGIYGLSLLTTLSFLTLAPKKVYFFTKWGASSIYVYLLHGFFIKYFRHSELTGILKQSEQIVVLTFLSLILIAILSSQTTKKLTRPIIEMGRRDRSLVPLSDKQK